jgi:hypothetical protein
MSVRSLVPAFLLCMASAVAPTLPASEPWSLLSRHGECARVQSLKRKIPELGEISDPQAFAALMRKGGHKVTITQTPTDKGTAYEIVVPERNLSVIFVPSEMCGTSGAR